MAEWVAVKAAKERGEEVVAAMAVAVADAAALVVGAVSVLRHIRQPAHLSHSAISFNHLRNVSGYWS